MSVLIVSQLTLILVSPVPLRRELLYQELTIRLANMSPMIVLPIMSPPTNCHTVDRLFIKSYSVRAAEESDVRVVMKLDCASPPNEDREDVPPRARWPSSSCRSNRKGAVFSIFLRSSWASRSPLKLRLS